MPTDVGFKIRPSSASDAVDFHTDQVTIDGVLKLLERVKLVYGAPGSGTDVSAANPMPTGDAAALTALASLLSQITSLTASNHTDLQAVTAALGGTLTVAPTGAGDPAVTLTDGRVTVTTPGTAVALGAALACKWVSVTALLTNTQQVNVGGSGVLAGAGSSVGTPLLAGDSVTIPVTNRSKVFVDARVGGEGVSFTVGS